MPTLKTDEIMAAVPAPSTAKQIAQRLRTTVRTVLPRLYALRAAGLLVRQVDDMSVARWARRPT